ncbi:hypothetical protein DL96DRAFT_1715027 [Flagelloscypha sp. PMI_526]|nr:hypothetical protein DL96DRAFT_1715027 [Flagelloscypha sp. PMI_526]
MSSDASSRPVTSRKGRGQSKKGCLTCKTRRVKCDEVHPICSTCSRRGDACLWNEEPNNNALQMLPRVARMALKPSRDHQLSVLPMNDFRPKELELLHTWTTHTLYTFIPDLPTIQNGFRATLPQIAFQHEFLLHALFAITSLHMHHLLPSSGHLPRAKMHCQHAVLGLFSNPTDATSLEAAVLSNILLATYWLGFTAWDSTRPDALPDVFNWIPAVKTFTGKIASYRQELIDGTLSTQSLVATVLLSGQPPSTISPFPSTFLEICLPEVCPYDTEELQDEQTLTAYELAVRSIVHCTWESFMIPGVQTLAVYGFFLLVPDEFFKLFLEKRPRALVIIAHYCAILGQFDDVWWYSWQRGRHDLQNILSLLDEKWLPYMEYPLNVLAMKDQIQDEIFDGSSSSSSSGAETSINCGSSGLLLPSVFDTF